MFDEIKLIVTRDTLLIYPDFNEQFDIHTDVSEFQIGEVISRNSKPIVFYSRKLAQLKQWYTLTEMEFDK